MTVDVKQKYEEERQKRQQVSKGLAQFLDRSHSNTFLVEDPWIQSGTPVTRPVPDGGRSKIVIFGAGFGGLLAAIKCLDTGAAKSPEDLLIVDPAGGFGGTWYWNRYPGLMCDIESYVYLPLLEETGYMPTRRYAGGEEIRNYCNIMAKHWNLEARAMFQSAGKSLTWDKDHWVCEIEEKPKGLPSQTVKIHTDYAILGSGGFTYPKIPNVPGLETFKGQMLHTARWNYDITGGTSANPVMDKLRDKRVAIVGTGATAIQAVPEIAKYAKELYVVQRTPSAVGHRGNRDTDPTEWKTKIANKKGWQAERSDNLQIFTEQEVDLPVENLIDDGFCAMPSISGAFGGPSTLTAADMPKHVEHLYKLDDARAEGVRARASEIVKNPETAKKLQAWYPGWCKRPTFHDEYLPTFNLPHVHLIDTDGQGLQSMSTSTLTVNNTTIPVDVLIWSTGYGSPLTESLAGKAEMAVTGKDGQDMEALNKSLDLKTLHGCTSYGFPNLFTTPLGQAGVGVNQVQRLEAQCVNIAYIIAEAEARIASGGGGAANGANGNHGGSSSSSKKVVIEPTEAACDRWGDEIASAAHLTGAILQCTPGYFTFEGDAVHLPPEALAKMAKAGLYGQGFLKYAKLMEEWRGEGRMEGVEVVGVAA